MAKKSAEAPWQALEQQAYHAYREWHLWLMLRERELSQRMGSRKAQPAATAAVPSPASPSIPTTGTPTGTARARAKLGIEKKRDLPEVTVDYPAPEEEVTHDG